VWEGGREDWRRETSVAMGLGSVREEGLEGGARVLSEV